MNTSPRRLSETHRNRNPQHYSGPHSLRGGAPTGYDRVLATRLGMALSIRKMKRSGAMAGSGTEIKYVLEEALTASRRYRERWDEVAVLFGCYVIADSSPSTDNVAGARSEDF